MKRLKFLVFGLVFGITFGCTGPYRAKPSKGALQETEKVVLLDHGLTYYLKTVKHQSNKMDGGQLLVKLAMENEEDKDVWVDIQVIFRGTDGFEVEKTQWEPFLFHRRKVTTFQRNSLKTSAADYRILIRNIKR